MISKSWEIWWKLGGRTYWIRGWIMRTTLSGSAPIHLGFISEYLSRNSQIHRKENSKKWILSILSILAGFCSSVWFCLHSSFWLNSNICPQSSTIFDVLKDRKLVRKPLVDHLDSGTQWRCLCMSGSCPRHAYMRYIRHIAEFCLGF